MSRYRVAVDVGGTFTDAVIFDEKTTEVSIAKVPSVPASPAQGIIDGIKEANITKGEQIRLFSHGTTVATNALITRRLPRTGLVTTAGFRDVLEIRRATKDDLWDAYKDVAPPYIPRRDRLEVEERIAYDGSVLTPLNQEQARQVAHILRRRQVESVAVSFINSYINPIHEQQLKVILQQELPGVMVTISSEVLPEIFEFERTSTTVANAVLGPVVGRYMVDLSRQLQQLGYGGEVLVLHSGGGVMTAASAEHYAARLAASGPAAGAVAMAYVAKLCGFESAMGLDMGGTSADISLMWKGDLRITRDWQVEYGYPIRFPSVDVITIGAGGGSLAWIDKGGSLRNGPQSAGADPGPASYIKGGTEPTNTDANLALGRLGPQLLGGKMLLHLDAARQAIDQRIGSQLGMDTVSAAHAIIQVANANMSDALRLISLQRGYDPRDFALVAFGGAGPLHAADLAREVNIPTIIVPPYPGALSAMGCLLVDMRHDLTKTVTTTTTKEDLAQLESEFRPMETELLEQLRREGVGEQDIELMRYLDMRYLGQWRYLSVPYTQDRIEPGQLLDAFHQEHEREFAYSQPELPVEIFGVRVTAVGKIAKPHLPLFDKRPGATVQPSGTRPVYFAKADGFVETPIFDRGALPAGLSLTGPAIVEQLDSTTVIPPGIRAEVDEYLNIIMHMD